MTSHNTLRFVTANINCSCLGIGWYALDEIYLNCLYVTAFFEALNSAELYIVNARELMSSAINLSRFDLNRKMEWTRHMYDSFYYF